MSRAQQDQFIDDDEEETCPLCVEEFDLTDKGFRPCPCGYQICQFCYHNVKNNMNGLCPACRRPYDEKNIEYKFITPEETAAHKARQAQRQKKTQAAIQKEKQKAEADHLSRKHLAGLRVVQKNLVYVTGLSPTSQEDQLLQTLRGDQYFGQYGKIIKIVVSKPPRDLTQPHSVGIYVTYERKEDAQSCITAVNGSKNGDRTLRAQFGTTKYCSAYLRNETCSNRNCMFLHEPGEANESYSRADLSALNAGSSQHGESRAPPPQSQQPIASAAQPMTRQVSDPPQSPVLDRPALPSSASWASRPSALQPSRTESRSTSGNLEAPTAPGAAPIPAQAEAPQVVPVFGPSSQPALPIEAIPERKPKPTQNRKAQPTLLWLTLLKDFNVEDFRFAFSSAAISQPDLEVLKVYPPLFDPSGGVRRRLRRQLEEEQRRMEDEVQAFQQTPAIESASMEMSGSLQLGGEPEGLQPSGLPASAIRPPVQDEVADDRFPSAGAGAGPFAIDRGITPQQQQQQQEDNAQIRTASIDQVQYAGQPTATQGSLHSGNAPPGHQRNVSRYTFANDTASASTAVKPVANPKLINQQNLMMPQAGLNQFPLQQDQRPANAQQFFTSNVQGPPPGLKTTGTPPVSGGMTFGQGHGFATGGLQYGVNASGRNANEEMMRNLLRGKDAGVDATGERELHFPSSSLSSHYNSNAAYQPASVNGLASQHYAFDTSDKQRSKKKGKKHGRHGNTSSSVSSGADIAGADPHLLQSRLQQGTGGLGNFGSQAASAGSGVYHNSGLHGSSGYGGRW